MNLPKFQSHAVVALLVFVICFFFGFRVFFLEAVFCHIEEQTKEVTVEAEQKKKAKTPLSYNRR